MKTKAIIAKNDNGTDAIIFPEGTRIYNIALMDFNLQNKLYTKGSGKRA